MEKTEIFPLKGMSCSSCAASAASIAQNHPGILFARALYPSGSLVLTYDPSKWSFADLKNNLAEVGYELYTVEETDQAKKDELKKLRFKKQILLFSGFATAILIYAAMRMPYSQASLVFQFVLTAIIMLMLGGSIYKNAWNQIIHRALAMDTLVAISTSIAFIFSSALVFFPNTTADLGLPMHPYFESIAVILFFISLGKWLEQKSTQKASAFLEKLDTQLKKFARLKTDGGHETIPIEAIQAGDIVTIYAGEVVPADGCVYSGKTEVDESMLSGESSPVIKMEKDPLYAGSLNLTGALDMRVTYTGKETTLGHIINRTEQARASQHPLQQLADRISRYFIPAMILISVLSGITWKILLPEEPFWILASVTVLIIACPCALGLATPVALVAAFGKAYSKGILLKNAQSLQQVSQLTDIVLDKTGTLTTGKLELIQEKWINKDKNEVLPLFISLANSSLHPVSRAIAGLAKTEKIAMSDCKEWPGKGISGKWGEKTLWIGNESLANQFLKNKWINDLSVKNGTIAYLGQDAELKAILNFSDQLKPDAEEIVNYFNQQGIKLHLLSGDSIQNTEGLAKKIGLSIHNGEITPENKALYIEELVRQNKCVAMVGDGINDAEALAKAHVSVSFAEASDLARNSAEIVLLNPQLKKLKELLVLGRKTSRVIKQNLFWAFFYNLVSIPLAAGVLYLSLGVALNPMIAGIAMAFSSISVVVNSLKLSK